MSYLIVVGGSSGIGKSCLEMMKNDYHNAINISRRPSKIVGVTDISIDMSQGFQSALLPKIERKSKICLVYSASTLTKDTIETFSLDDFSNVFNVNVKSLSMICSHLLPLMGSGSSIIIIGSTLSEKAAKKSFLYTSSKHAQLGIMRSIVQDTAGRGVHSTLVCPGFTNTEMLMKHLNHSKEVLNYIKSMTSFGRLIEPSEIALEVRNISKNPIYNGAVIHLNLGQKEI